MKKIFSMALVIALVIGMTALVSGCSTENPSTIISVYSPTREALREKCIAALLEENITVTEDNTWIRSSYVSGDGAYITFIISNDEKYKSYNLEGQYNYTFFKAMTREDENKETQEEVIQLLNRLEFEISDDNTIKYRENKDSNVTKEWTFDDIPVETTTTTTISQEETLKEIAFEKLGIGFSNACVGSNYNGTSLEVYAVKDAGWPEVAAMFVENEFMENHDVVFETSGTMEKYIPPTIEDNEPVDFFGCVERAKLDTHTAIKIDGYVKIIIDGEYIIIVNPE